MSEAADRLRRIEEGYDPHDIYRGIGDGLLSARITADLWELYRSEHQADDEEPITKDWLASIGWECVDGNCVLPLLPLGFLDLYWRQGGVDFVTADGLFAYRVELSTRGQLRRLAAALGVGANNQ